MPNSDGSSEKMKPWSREITQKEWDAIFNPPDRMMRCEAKDGEDHCDKPGCEFCGGPDHDDNFDLWLGGM